MSLNPSLNSKATNKPSDYYEGINQLLFKMVPLEASRILEVGCATGRLGQAVKFRNSNCHYTGIELFPEAAEQARKVLDKVFISDVERFDWTNLKGECFDCIIFADVLEHLVEPEATVKAVTALLKPDGFLLCCLPNVSHWSVIKGLLQGDWEYADSGVLDRTHLRFYTIKTFKALLKECGFQMVKYSKYFTEDAVEDAVVPLLNSLQVDIREFMERAKTIQFLVKAERIPDLTAPVQKSSLSEQPIKAVPIFTVAIVVCITDGQPFTDRCMDSLAKANSSQSKVQLVLVDDANCEADSQKYQSLEQRYPWVHIIRHDKPQGILQCRNEAFAGTNAEVVVFLDGNCIVEPQWLNKMLRIILDNKVGIVGPQMLYPDGSVSHTGIVFPESSQPEFLFRGLSDDDARLAQPLQVPAVTASCLVIKRDVYMLVQGFNTKLPVFFSDLDLNFRVRQLGLSVVYQPESRVVHPETGNGYFMRLAEAHDGAGQRAFSEKWGEMIQRDRHSDPVLLTTGRRYTPPRHS